MYFKIFRTQSWGKKTGQDKTGFFRGALQFVVLLQTARQTVGGDAHIAPCSVNLPCRRATNGRHYTHFR